MYNSEKLNRFIKNKKLVISVGMVFIIIIIAIFGPMLVPYRYEEMDTGVRLTPPSKDNFFGTDNFGRDLFSRVIYGARYSLLIAFLVVILSNFIGITIGAFSGYIGGKLDIIVMRFIDVIFTIPSILIAMLIVMSVGRGISTVIISLSIINAPQIARVVRGSALSIKEKEYIQTAKISGENTISIIVKYILANGLGPIIVQSTMILAYAILAEASLSYLGYGVAPPVPSWGLLLEGATRFYVGSPYLIYFPGFAIIVTVISFSFLGDGLRDLLDPKFNPL